MLCMGMEKLVIVAFRLFSSYKKLDFCLGLWAAAYRAGLISDEPMLNI
jgi:hypothetical protein